MKISDGISMSARDIRRRKLRSILTIIAIAVGSMLLVTMQGVGDSITKTTNTFIESFGDMNQVTVMPQKYDKNQAFGAAAQEQSQESSATLPYMANTPLNPKQKDNTKEITNETLTKLSKITNVQSVSAYEASKISSLDIDGINKQGESSVILGYNKNFSYKQDGKIVAGSNLTGKNDQFLVNENYLKNMGITDFSSVVGKNITLTVKMPEIPGMPKIAPLKIKGVIQGVYKEKTSYYPGNIITFSDVTNKINAYYQGKNVNDVKPSYSMVNLEVPSQTVISGVVNEVNNNLGYTTFYLGEVVGIASIFTGFVKTVLDLAAIIVIAVAAIGLANTMTMTIQEKRKWIGIMRSIGATKKDITIIFLSQSIILGIIGGIAGCIVAALSILGINEWLSIAGKNFSISLTSGSMLLGFIVAFIVAILAGIIPARGAARMKVVETLNEE